MDGILCRGGDAGALLMKRPPFSSLPDIAETMECRRVSPNSDGASSGVTPTGVPEIRWFGVLWGVTLSSAASSVALTEDFSAVASSSMGLPSEYAGGGLSSAFTRSVPPSAGGLDAGFPVPKHALFRLWRKTTNAKMASTSETPTTLPAIAAFVPAESPASPADSAVPEPVADAVAAAVPVLLAEVRLAEASIPPVAAAVTANPSTQEMVPPVDPGRLACLVSACSPTKSVALSSQSQLPGRRSRLVYALVGTEHPAQAHWFAVSSTASQRIRPTHSCSSKSSDFQGHELSVYCESVQPAR